MELTALRAVVTDFATGDGENPAVVETDAAGKVLSDNTLLKGIE